MNVYLYDINALVMKRTQNEFKAYYGDEERVIIAGTNGLLVASFNGEVLPFNTPGSEYHINVLKNEDNPDVQIPDDNITVQLREILEDAPRTEVDSRKYFHKRAASPEDKEHFIELRMELELIGVNTVEL